MPRTCSTAKAFAWLGRLGSETAMRATPCLAGFSPTRRQRPVAERPCGRSWSPVATLHAHPPRRSGFNV